VIGSLVDSVVGSLVGSLVREPDGSDGGRRLTLTAMLRVRIVFAALIVFVALAPAGCGDDGPAERGDVAPDAWAGQVCQALTPWRGEIDALMIRAQQRMDAAIGPDQAKNGLVELLGGAEASSEQARSRVAAAGLPDADNGRRVAAEFVESLRRTRDAYGKAKVTIAALPTAEAKVFYDAVASAFGQLNTDYAAGAIDLEAVRSSDLKRAFDEVPACR
jgi:hypothetical protein